MRHVEFCQSRQSADRIGQRCEMVAAQIEFDELFQCTNIVGKRFEVIYSQIATCKHGQLSQAVWQRHDAVIVQSKLGEGCAFSERWRKSSEPVVRRVKVPKLQKQKSQRLVTLQTMNETNHTLEIRRALAIPPTD